jgi:molybdopterin-guanine dinucleotide biosynthesis protein A
MKYLAGILLVLMVAAAPSCKYFRDRGIFGRKAKALAELRAQQDSIRVADSIRKVQEHLIALENARQDSIQQAEAALIEASKHRYNIIVGSFITPEYARDFAEYYRQEGYDPQILKMDGTDFELVAAEAHQSLRKAISRLEQFQDTVQIDAWIYIRQ